MSEVMFTARVPSGRAKSPVLTVVPPETEASPAVQKLREHFPDAVQEVTEFRGDYTVTIRSQDLVRMATFLRDDPELRFQHLADLSSQDRLRFPGQGNSPRFASVYHLYSLANDERLRLKVPAPGGDNPVVPTLTGIWPGANWHEREVYDLMGIRFEGHPDMRRILMPPEWPNHPLRKDVPAVANRCLTR